jgi:hypothetical protein
MAGQTKSERGLFVPGFRASVSRNIQWSGAEKHDTIDFVRNNDREGNTIKTSPWFLVPKKIGKWGWGYLDRIDLPEGRFQVGMIELFGVQFDCDPGEVWLRLDYQRDSDWTWKVLSQFRNFYGGRYNHPFQMAVPEDLLQGTGSFGLRIGMMVRRRASYPTYRPPVAVFVKTAEPLPIIGNVHFWRELHPTKTSVGADQETTR